MSKGIYNTTAPLSEHVGALRKSLQVFEENHKRILNSFKPIPKFNTNLNHIIKQRVLLPTFPKLKLFLHWENHGNACKQLYNQGWLPHYTMSHLKDNPYEDKEVTEELLNYYKYDWPEHCEIIREEHKIRNVDDITIDTFNEAFKAYENGMYRSVTRLLFPEAERLARKSFPEINNKATYTSLKEIRDLAGKLTVDSTAFGWTGFTIYKSFVNFCYEPTNKIDEGFLHNKIPNRHAAIHGIVDYNCAQSSLNTIFLIDFVIQTILSLK